MTLTLCGPLSRIRDRLILEKKLEKKGVPNVESNPHCAHSKINTLTTRLPNIITKTCRKKKL